MDWIDKILDRHEQTDPLVLYNPGGSTRAALFTTPLGKHAWKRPCFRFGNGDYSISNADRTEP